MAESPPRIVKTNAIVLRDRGKVGSSDGEKMIQLIILPPMIAPIERLIHGISTFLSSSLVA